MKTVKEFMQNVVDYFGGIPNDKVKELYVSELRFVKPSDLDHLFRQLIIDQPQSFCPDYKALIDAVKKSNISLLNDVTEELKKCPVCGTIKYTTGCCTLCKYDGGFKDGSPEEYKKFWDDWKKNGPRFDTMPIFQNLINKNEVIPNEF
jgi:hypothetical protein